MSYIEMCQLEGASLQRGMNFRLHDTYSVILMSRRPGAPYKDQVLEDGRVLIYEGHDIPRSSFIPDPKAVDQPSDNPNGTLTQNGLFYEAANRFKARLAEAEVVKVYEKIRSGIWVFNGFFQLVDAWEEKRSRRSVFKFKLQLTDDLVPEVGNDDLDHDRLIPTSVKLEVWKRDKGRCVLCGSSNNLHFDHVIPFSKGGSSLVASNIQLLCARHNLAKRDKIQ